MRDVAQQHLGDQNCTLAERFAVHETLSNHRLQFIDGYDAQERILLLNKLHERLCSSLRSKGPADNIQRTRNPQLKVSFQS